MSTIIRFLMIISSSFYFITLNGADNLNLTVEELRIEKAMKQMPDVVKRLEHQIKEFKTNLKSATNIATLVEILNNQGKQLWRNGINSYVSSNDFDDRPLYWARLQASKALRQSPFFQSLPSETQEELLWQLELVTRGAADISFDKNSTKKILITGFDPFFLDRHINQSNPSGAVAMALDNTIIKSNGNTAEIESLIVPVRFEDFDKGMIEELLTPYMKNKSVDMIITISMGRDNFDLERFPGLRRSANAPDNLNVYTGASKKSPLIPLLKGKPLIGSEFLQFSLPVGKMIQAEGAFSITDNHKVSTLEKTFSMENIYQANNQISVSGSGGGYLSNEISYRSLLLRDRYNPHLPVGHIHTPRFKQFEPDKIKAINEQIKSMISHAIVK